MLHDPNNVYFSTADLTAYINTARKQIAIESQSIRVLISGAITAVAVTNGGASYAATTTISFSSPSGGVGAVATPTIAGGVIQSVAMNANGAGFDTGATATASDPTGAGSGAVLAPTVSGANVMVINQEVYTFASRNAAAALTSGVSAIHGVLGIAASWGSSKPSLQRLDWGSFQAYYRPWAVGWTNNPVAWAQYGQGALGSVYLAPIPSSAFAMEWDTYCVPIALAADSDPEAIPYPWTDAIRFRAAYLALLGNAQRANDATNMYNLYNNEMKLARKNSDPPFIPDPYSTV